MERDHFGENEEFAEGLQRDTSPRRILSQLPDGGVVQISLPEVIEIILVDARELSDYEGWSLATSVLSSALAGFVVAYVQSQETTLLVISIVFALLFILSFLMSFYKRRRLWQTKRISYGIGQIVPLTGENGDRMKSKCAPRDQTAA